MTKQTLNSRDAIEHLVRTFYQQVRQDELIGPIFNKHIKDWEAHLQKLTDFWETNLLFVRRYKGNPLGAHIAVDKSYNYQIQQVHFGRWLQLWFQTIDTYFEGENAQIAKNRARNMSTHMFMKIYTHRSKALGNHI